MILFLLTLKSTRAKLHGHRDRITIVIIVANLSSSPYYAHLLNWSIIAENDRDSVTLDCTAIMSEAGTTRWVSS